MSDPIPFRHPPVLPMTEEQRAHVERMKERSADATRALDEATREVRTGMARRQSMAAVLGAIMPSRRRSDPDDPVRAAEAAAARDRKYRYSASDEEQRDCQADHDDFAYERDGSSPHRYPG